MKLVEKVVKSNKWEMDKGILYLSGIRVYCTLNQLEKINQLIEKELSECEDSYITTYLKQIKWGVNSTNITTFNFISKLLGIDFKSQKNRYVEVVITDMYKGLNKPQPKTIKGIELGREYQVNRPFTTDNGNELQSGIKVIPSDLVGKDRLRFVFKNSEKLDSLTFGEKDLTDFLIR